MVREYYDSNDSDDGERKPQHDATNVAGPISAWLVLLFVALAIKFFVSNVSIASSGSIGGVLASASNFILFFPGDIILPLVIGAAIGAEVGIRSKSMSKAGKAGLINGVYAAIVYSIGIVVIYEVLSAVFPSITPSSDFLLLSWIALPVIICIALSEAFALLSYSRKVSS
ncbi:MAG: hypothetical protein M1286_04475 [Candidatus Marsarchaeota archaeon]|nr:hypothetical protein [Candidatus Marsarchaeota archaeon]